MRKTINNREFVRTWMKFGSASQVASKMNLSLPSVYTKANNLRKKGVNLPPSAHNQNQDTVDDLNKIIASYSKGAK